MKTETGSCHCGAVEFEVDLENGYENVRRCNCSICSRKGAIMAGVPLDRLRITPGADKLSLHQWNTKIAKHYFCSVCGIYTHHQRRSMPTEYGFNLACIEGIDLAAVGPIGARNGAAQTVRMRSNFAFGGNRCAAPRVGPHLAGRSKIALPAVPSARLRPVPRVASFKIALADISP